MRRIVEPELLDELPPAEAQAVGSRADLRRLNAIMGHAGIITRAFQFCFRAGGENRRLRVVELGAGDGTLILRLARNWAALGITASVTLVDRQTLLSSETRQAIEALGWSVETVESDVFAWLKQSPTAADLVLSNLFLHHFEEKELGVLLSAIATMTTCFIACEPRRAGFALFTSRLLGLIGCNAVTRHDAVVSVRAGFSGNELTALWPTPADWECAEKPAGLFSHCFAVKPRA